MTSPVATRLLEAMQPVREKGLSQRKVAAEFGISHVTLSRRLKNPYCTIERGGETKYTVEEEANFAKLSMCYADLFFFT